MLTEARVANTGQHIQQRTCYALTLHLFIGEVTPLMEYWLSLSLFGSLSLVCWQLAYVTEWICVSLDTHSLLMLCSLLALHKSNATRLQIHSFNFQSHSNAITLTVAVLLNNIHYNTTAYKLQNILHSCLSLASLSSLLSLQLPLSHRYLAHANALIVQMYAKQWKEWFLITIIRDWMWE